MKASGTSLGFDGNAAVHIPCAMGFDGNAAVHIPCASS